MMRYQRPNGDCLPLNSGRKSNLRRTAFKEDGCSTAAENGRSIPSYTTTTSSSSFEEKSFTRFRSSPSKPQDDDDDIRSTTTPQFDRNGCTSNNFSLQWGHNKRARVSRNEISSQVRQPIKAHHGRGAHQGTSGILGDKISIPTASAHRPPPPAPPPQPFSLANSSRKGRGFNGHYGNGLLSTKETSGLLPHRNLEDRSGAVNGSPSRNGGVSSRIVSRSSAGKRSPSCAEKFDRKMHPSGSLKKDDNPTKASLLQPERQSGDEKGKVQALEWPRIYIGLSKKEKEDDFLAMKGTKLPHRPKKRAKNIDKSLQYCFPGMWLSELTRGRYEVREKKCVKKQKGRGLKGMESIESDSH